MALAAAGDRTVSGAHDRRPVSRQAGGREDLPAFEVDPRLGDARIEGSRAPAPIPEEGHVLARQAPLPHHDRAVRRDLRRSDRFEPGVRGDDLLDASLDGPDERKALVDRRIPGRAHDDFAVAGDIPRPVVQMAWREGIQLEDFAFEAPARADIPGLVVPRTEVLPADDEAPVGGDGHRPPSDVVVHRVGERDEPRGRRPDEGDVP